MSRPPKPDAERSCRASPVLLAGSLPDTGALKTCSVCERQVTPAGGVAITPTRYCCGSCWKARSGHAGGRARLITSVAHGKPLVPSSHASKAAP